MTVEEVEYPFCSRCHEHADFERDEETGELLSTCCSRRPVSPDPEVPVGG